MLRPQNYAIDGYARPGYFAPWSTGYVKQGYVRDGYVRTQPRNVTHPAMSFDLRRLPAYPEFTIEFNQWSKESGGGVMFVGDPYAVRVYHSLSWSSLPGADRDNLETFFRTVACGESQRWVWWNPVNGNALPVRFADPTFPATPEVAFGYYSMQGLRLMVDINFPAQAASGAPNYSAAMRTAFSIGSVVMCFPDPETPNTGYGVTTRYMGEDTSAGRAVAYRSGMSTRRTWTLSWKNLHYIHWIRLQAFFCTFVRGMRIPFTWFDYDGTPRTVRLAQNKITVTQTNYDLFACDLSLQEEV